MDILKKIPDFRIFFRNETGKDLNRNFDNLAADLQIICNTFTAQGRTDAAEGQAPRFTDIYLMITAANPREGEPLSRLMKLCYEEGYNGST